MSTGILRASLLIALACGFGSGHAHADIYTWVDPTGRVNVSNLPPPDGVRVTGVTLEIPQKAAVRIDAARDAAREAELQLLSDRVRQLEQEVELASRPAPAPVMQSAVVMQWTPVQYQIEIAPPANPGCDPAWADCGGSWGTGWGSGFYPSTIFVPRPPNGRRPHPAPKRTDLGLPPLYSASGSFFGR